MRARDTAKWRGAISAKIVHEYVNASCVSIGHNFGFRALCQFSLARIRTLLTSMFRAIVRWMWNNITLSLTMSTMATIFHLSLSTDNELVSYSQLLCFRQPRPEHIFYASPWEAEKEAFHFSERRMLNVEWSTLINICLGKLIGSANWMLAVSDIHAMNETNIYLAVFAATRNRRKLNCYYSNRENSLEQLAGMHNENIIQLADSPDARRDKLPFKGIEWCECAQDKIWQTIWILSTIVWCSSDARARPFTGSASKRVQTSTSCDLMLRSVE